MDKTHFCVRLWIEHICGWRWQLTLWWRGGGLWRQRGWGSIQLNLHITGIANDKLITSSGSFFATNLFPRLAHAAFPSYTYLMNITGSSRLNLFVFAGVLTLQAQTYFYINQENKEVFQVFKPSRCIDASFYIPENRLISQQLGVLEWKFPRIWFTNTWQLSLIFHSLQVIFIHYKSRIAAAIRGL